MNVGWKTRVWWWTSEIDGEGDGGGLELLSDGFGDILVSIEGVALADDLHAPDMNQDSGEVNQDGRSRILTVQILIRLGVDEVDDVQRDLEDGQEQSDSGERNVWNEKRTTIGSNAMEHHEDKSELKSKS